MSKDIDLKYNYTLLTTKFFFKKCLSKKDITRRDKKENIDTFDCIKYKFKTRFLHY